MTRTSGSIGWFFVLVLVLGGCAPLTKNQVSFTRTYYEAITNYPEFYREMNSRVAEVNMGARKLESALTKDDSLKVQLLIKAIQDYEEELQIPDTVQYHIRVVEDYIQKYFILIPKGFDIYRLIKSTSVTLGSLVGFGGVTKGIMPDASLKVSKAKARKIKRHMTSSSEEFRASLTTLKQYLSQSYIPRLNQIDNQSRSNLESLLLDLSVKPDPIVFFRDYNQVVTNYYQRVFLTKQLGELLIRSINVLLEAEEEVNAQIAERNKTVNPSTKQTELVRIVARMRSVNEKIQLAKSNN